MIMRLNRVVLLLILAGLLAGCASLSGPKYPTLIPTEYVPTAIALTVEAGRSKVAVTPVDVPGNPPSPSLSASPLTTLASATAERTAAASPASAASPAVTSTPRPVVSPTITPAAGKTTQPTGGLYPPRPTATASRLPTLAGATSTPQVTATLTPTLRFQRTLTSTATPGIPNAAILLYNPGPMSKLTSPIQFSASLQPGPSGQVQIELLGEDGRTLYRKMLRYTTRDWVAISENVEFSIAAAAEAARLQISTEDAQGRIMALASVDLLLLAMGDDDLNPPTDLLEPLIIREPVPNTLIQGGKVIVTGLVRTSGEQPLLVELVDAKGVVVGYRQAVVTLPANPWATQGYATFMAEVPYSVEGPTWVRLDVSAFEDRLPGPTHLSSLEILLGP